MAYFGTIQERFSKKLGPKDSHGCVPWLGARQGCKGREYGNFRTQSRRSPQPAHRVAWVMANGPIPEGLEVCHKCDNSLCVNPEHLFLGTHKDNMQDCIQKGRFVFAQAGKGEVHGRSKLTDEQVLEIRKLYRKPVMGRYGVSPVSCRGLAEQFGVCEGMIYNIVHGKNWKHLLPTTA